MPANRVVWWRRHHHTSKRYDTTPDTHHRRNNWNRFGIHRDLRGQRREATPQERDDICLRDAGPFDDWHGDGGHEIPERKHYRRADNVLFGDDRAADVPAP